MVDYEQFYYQKWPILKWEQAIVSVLNFSRLPQEPVDDILRLAGAFGHCRASLRNADFEIQMDVPHVLSMYCWWPFKPKLSRELQEYVFENRWKLLQQMPTVRYYTQLAPLTEFSEETIEWARNTAPINLLSMKTQEMFNAMSAGELP